MGSRRASASALGRGLFDQECTSPTSSTSPGARGAASPTISVGQGLGSALAAAAAADDDSAAALEAAHIALEVATATGALLPRAASFRGIARTLSARAPNAAPTSPPHHHNAAGDAGEEMSSPIPTVARPPVLFRTSPTGRSLHRCVYRTLYAHYRVCVCVHLCVYYYWWHA